MNRAVHVFLSLGVAVVVLHARGTVLDQTPGVTIPLSVG